MQGTPIPRTSQPDKMFNLAITRDLEKEDRLEMWGVQIVAPKRDARGRRVAGTLHGRCSHTVSRANDFSHGIWKIKSGIRVNRLAREIRQELVESFSTAENRVDLDYCYVSAPCDTQSSATDTSDD